MKDWMKGWHVTGHKNLLVNHENGNTLCMMPNTKAYQPIEEMQEMALLIASAPDLLHALKTIQANPNDPWSHRVALDAIKKAEG